MSLIKLVDDLSQLKLTNHDCVKCWLVFIWPKMTIVEIYGKNQHFHSPLSPWFALPLGRCCEHSPIQYHGYHDTTFCTDFKFNLTTWLKFIKMNSMDQWPILGLCNVIKRDSSLKIHFNLTTYYTRVKCSFNAFTWRARGNMWLLEIVPRFSRLTLHAVL